MVISFMNGAIGYMYEAFISNKKNERMADLSLRFSLASSPTMMGGKLPLHY